MNDNPGGIGLEALCANITRGPAKFIIMGSVGPRPKWWRNTYLWEVVMT